ncbi:MAG: DNA replication and repair protein RecF [Turneriella sp.]|nr:DNA replication and repair protein RecF [Turneriella sp.]
MIKNLNLLNFRNCEKAAYEFGNGLIFITGDNGTGKTTILEAIGLVSFLKSFRFALDREMIRFDASFYRVEATFAAADGEHKIAIAYGKNPGDEKAALAKKYTFDGRTNEKAAAIIGRIPTVVLSPDDMRIIAGDHSERRRFLDLLLSMLYPAYFAALQHYHRALKLRSQTLKARPDEAMLVAVDRELAQAGVEILEKRRQFIPEFTSPFAQNVEKISGAKDAWTIDYRGDTGQVKSTDDYMAMLKERRANDLRLRQTTSGIHRDRIFFTQGGNLEREIRNVGSQGQKRTAALALKTAQFNYMHTKLGTTPVLLIDDILNELDLSRRASFIDFLGGGDVGQVFFTTTDLVGMQDFLRQMEKSAVVQNIVLNPTP